MAATTTRNQAEKGLASLGAHPDPAALRRALLAYADTVPGNGPAEASARTLLRELAEAEGDRPFGSHVTSDTSFGEKGLGVVKAEMDLYRKWVATGRIALPGRVKMLRAVAKRLDSVYCSTEALKLSLGPVAVLYAQVRE